MNKIIRIIPPSVTIFNRDEKPDYAGCKRVIEFLIAGGVDGILVLGSSGEFTALSRQDKRDFFQFYAETVAGRVKLYAGTACPDFQDTVALSNDVVAMGYEGAMVIGPYYYALDQGKIFTFYDTLAKRMNGGKLFIYNFPARSGHSVAPETLRKLLEANSNIAGLKDSVTEPTHTNLLCIAARGYPFEIYSGFDDQYLANIASGGAGCIGGLANLVPEIWSDLISATREKNFDRTFAVAHLIHRLMPLYNMDCNFSYLFKRLMVHRGLDVDPRAIFPYSQLDGATCDRAAAILDEVIADYKKLA